MQTPKTPERDERERWLEAPVFVTGLMKSGTSLLLALLDGHDDLLVYPDEPSFMRLYGRSYRDKNELTRDFLFGTPNPLHFNRFVQEERLAPLGFSPKDWCPVPAEAGLDSIDTRELAARIELRGALPGEHTFDVVAYHERLREELDRLDGASPRGAVLATARALEAGARPRKRPARWLFKQPLPTYRASTFDTFFRDFPEGRLIVILRDPRAFMISLLDYVERFGERPFGVLRKRRYFLARLSSLASDYQAFLETPTRYGQERVALIRYEDFITDTHAAMTRLARFLDVPFQEALLTPSKAGGRVRVPTATRSGGDRVYTESLHRYREDLSAAELAAIEAAIHPLFDAPGFGYARETHPALTATLAPPVRALSKLAAALRPVNPKGAPR